MVTQTSTSYSIPKTPQAAPEQPRQIGRSRTYTATNLPERLRHWHTPRVNRWERLCVMAGALVIEYLEASGAARQVLAGSEQRWIAPGMRWRVAQMDTDSRFELAIHADSKGQAEAPQLLRSDLLQDAERVAIPGVAAFNALVRTLPIGERRIVTGRFGAGKLTAILSASRTLFWHPLAATSKSFTALVARGRRPFDLVEYLGRDHAVIEAALGRALMGDTESERWLRATLERHLRIEEHLIFPTYIEAGGREAWVRGLTNEHIRLRHYLFELDQPLGRKRFLRLLDGHDEKEERVVYPDILAHLGERAADLLARAITCPIKLRIQL
ncbi:MAG TPA: DUF1971 domain-containing protein [Gammaproteobacteria bacterium]|nr:DUF1971 domain-containing protein [Gammaproteobacteria bacterium]